MNDRDRDEEDRTRRRESGEHRAERLADELLTYCADRWGFFFCVDGEPHRWLGDQCSRCNEKKAGPSGA